MKWLIAVLAVCLLATCTPIGCVMSLAFVGGSIAAASTDRQCTSQARPDTAVCTQGGAQSSRIGATTAIDLRSIPAPDSEASIAVEAAIEAASRHGRYVAEGNGPVDFDCSGLTAFAWRTAGVNLEDYSFTQWDQTRHIPREAVAPGDLVFWFRGEVHHVAIVVAVNGAHVQIAEAANPEVGIRIRDFGDTWDQTYLTGFGRVVR